MRTSKLGTWSLPVLLLLWGAAVHGSDEAASAREILKAAGRETGLCICLGCGREGSAALPAELAAQSRMLVHGLAFDEAALARARAAIEARTLLGRAVVERVEPKPLPYVADLANVAVIEDPAALAARGVSLDDVLRVVAPEGVLCVFKNGAWSATVKPRPKEMDEWSHVQHGPDGNMVSTDKLLHFPLGLRWVDGLAKNLNRWASVRGWVVAGGRCYALSATEYENLGPPRKKEHYLVARDAFNGLPLWKLNCETSDDGAALFWLNAGPLVADARRAYAVKKDRPVAVDGATGQVAVTFNTQFLPVRLLLLQDVLVAVCWEGRDVSKSPLVKGSLWATWVNKSDKGSVEAFDARSGSPKWSLPVAAQAALAAGETVYVLAQAGNPPTSQDVIAVDLKSGKERWRVPCAKLGADPDLQLSVAGPGYVLVTKRKSGSLAALAEHDGRVLWEEKLEPKADAKTPDTPCIWTPVVDGLLWFKNQKREPLTGEKKGNTPTWIGAQGCTPSVLVGNLVTQSRGCTYLEFPAPGDTAGKAQTLTFRGARGACMEGMVPANGMFYTAQNNCTCAPGQILGFLAFGPNGPDPVAADFEKARGAEPGPAFGKAEDASSGGAGWPLYRGNAARAGACAGTVPEKPALLWRTPLLKETDGPLTPAWKARLLPPLTAPVAAGGLVVAAGTETNQVYACAAATGKRLWSATLGGRVDSAPTLHRGLCVVGSHDGRVYALRAKDGQEVWRIRVAPFERRVVVQGQVESVWPAVGTVLVHDDVLYVNAGRGSENDGGVAVMALEPATGKTVWSKAIGGGPLHRNDLLRAEDGALLWNDVKLDLKTGAILAGGVAGKANYSDPLLDGPLAGLLLKRKDLKIWNATLSVQAGAQCAAYPAAPVPASAAPPTPPAPAPADGTKPAVPAAPAALWTARLPEGAVVNAAALGDGRAVLAGALNGKPGGRVWVLALKDGAVLSETELPAPPVYDGVALADGRIYVTLQNGELTGLGEGAGGRK